MVVLTLIFAVLNICLGFALAMYLRADSFESVKAGEDSGINPAKAEAEPAAGPENASSNPAS